MLRPWDEGTGYLDPTPRDSKERGETEGCCGPVLRPGASNAVVDHVGVKMARGRLKERRARARPLFSSSSRPRGKETGELWPSPGKGKA